MWGGFYGSESKEGSELVNGCQRGVRNAGNKITGGSTQDQTKRDVCYNNGWKKHRGTLQKEDTRRRKKGRKSRLWVRLVAPWEKAWEEDEAMAGRGCGS